MRADSRVRWRGDSLDKGGKAKRGTTGLQTTCCVVCGGEPSVYTGHVVRGGRTVIAGWCRDHPHETQLWRGMLSTGCYGHVCEVTFGGNLRPLRSVASGGKP